MNEEQMDEPSGEFHLETGIYQRIIAKIKSSKIGCSVFIASAYCAIYGGMNYYHRQQRSLLYRNIYKQTRLECSQFPGCQALYDGCNMCQCQQNGMDICTLMFCDRYEIGKCKECERGYTLSPKGTCQKPACGGFKHCASYFDGCNNCDCLSDGTELCSEMYCNAHAYKQSKCNQCEVGFQFDIYNQCMACGHFFECPMLKCADPCPLGQCQPFEECVQVPTFLKSRPGCKGCSQSTCQ